MTPDEAAGEAATIDELLASVARFVSLLSPGEAALLPPGDNAREGVSPNHIRDAAVRLAHARSWGTPEASPEQVQRMFAFFTEAASRLGQLEFIHRS
jgi:hypothetical protein